MSPSSHSQVNRFSLPALLPRHADGDELLDLGVGTPNDVQESLDDLWRINRFLGGVTALTRHLYPYLRQHNGEVTLLDVGAGSGQIALAIAQWAGKRGCRLRVVGLDIAARHLKIAGHHLKQIPNVHLIQADALELPLPERSVDYLISSLFVHHLQPHQVIALLKQSFQCVRRAVIISDLERGWLPLLAFRAVQPVFARSYLTRHDGALSIRRAYTPAELHSMALEAGLHHVRIYRHFPWRMTLVAEK